MAGVRGLPLSELVRIVDRPDTTLRLATYFTTFTGRRFELLGGGGDCKPIGNRITAEDLLAVQMLNVLVPATRTIDLLEGDLGNEISAQLMKIPTRLNLGAPGAYQHLADDGPAATAWNLLNPRRRTGIGWVIAGKILARKRPRLIPVYDSVVRCAVGKPAGYWQWLDNRFRENGGVLVERLEAARARAGISREVSTLRVFDVAVWTHHREAHTAKKCTGAARAAATVEPMIADD